uniref:Uncharacterized protein LOC102801367 n=1 Tax=Saccoglossus kowalevskii TaxID=10224 RepID=A0ABM0MKW0_SACKO
QNDIQLLQKKLDETTHELRKVNYRNDELDNYIRRENLRFYGIGEQPGEDTEMVLRKFIRDELKIPEPDAMAIEFQRVHRLHGQRSRDRPRGIIARFVRYKDREKVRKSAGNLKDTAYSVREDYSQGVLQKRRELMPLLKQARRDIKRAFLVAEKLYIDGNIYNKVQNVRNKETDENDD